MRRYLFSAVVVATGPVPAYNKVVTVSDGGSVSVDDFCGELHSTTFVNGVLFAGAPSDVQDLCSGATSVSSLAVRLAPFACGIEAPMWIVTLNPLKISPLT